MSEACFVLLSSILVTVAVILLITACCFYEEICKLRKDNKLLRRVLEEYYQLEDGSKRAARAMAREAKRSSWLPPEW